MTRILNMKGKNKNKHDKEEGAKLNDEKNDKEECNSAHHSARKFAKVTVEPIPGVVGLVVWMCQISIQNLFLESACMVDLGQPRNECIYGIDVESPHEVESQKLVASVNILRGFLESVVIMFVLIFICPWSDFSGRRKITILLPLLGLAVATFNALLIVTFPSISVTWVIYLIQFPQAITGSQCLLFVGLFNYLGDLCFTTTRNMATACIIIMISNISCMAIGTVIGPVILRQLGYYGVFGISFAIQIINLVYICKYVKEVKLNKSNKISLLSSRLPLSALKCVFMKREGYKRCCIMLMIIVDALDKVIYIGDLNIQYLFVRKQLGWTDVIYGSFLCYKYAVSIFGLLFILYIMKKRLKLSDCVVGIMGSISQSLNIATLMLATNSYVLFFGPMIGFLNQGSVAVQRAVLNKHIQIDEQGKIGSMIGALISVILMAIAPVFNAVYKLTVDVFPAAYMCISLISALVQIASYVATRSLSEKQALHKTSEEEPMNKNNEIHQNKL